MEPQSILKNDQITPKELKALLNNPSDQFNWLIRFNSHGEQIFYSDNFTLITGYTADELRTPHFKNDSIILPEYYSAVKNEFNRFFNSETTNDFIIQYKIKTKDEQKLWLSETLKSVRDSQGKIIAAYCCSKNVTEYIEELDKLGAAINELRSSIHAKDGFISILSHDLRAPFTSILGFSEILLNESHLSETDKNEYLNFINQSSQNQLQLINYMLEWSRLQMDKLKLDIQRIQLQNIVFNCVSFLTGNAVRKNIEIKVNVDSSLYVDGDDRLLVQAVLGLISNGIKYSHENQIVEVSACVYDDQYIELSVKDEGVGISELHKQKLFKIDKLFSSEGTKGEKGTGLGLTLVKEIVEKLGGQIWYFSEVDKGSEFHITIPRSKETILIVTDDLSQYAALKKNLDANFPAYNLLSADSGYHALELIKTRIPSLIIINHDLPLMSGLQLLHVIRKKEKNSAVPVIILSQSLSDQIVSSYKEAGIDTVITDLSDENEVNTQLNKFLINKLTPH